MTDENKDLGDEAKDALDNANKKAENLGDKAKDATDKGKEEAKDLGDKAGDAFDSAKEKASDFSDDAKEKASDFADKAEEAAKDFKDNVKETFSSNNSDNGKTVAIIAHLTLIGWIIALIMNNGNKTEIGSFYIRQVLGIMLLGFVLGMIPIVNFIAWIIPLVLWVISLVGALGDKQKPVLLIGDYFQDWFKSL
jgi:hypothetical protein